MNSNSITDATWQQIRQRNIRVFESYYKEHYKEFFLASFKYVKNNAVAEEVVNDVFIKIWQNVERITIESSLKAYIYRAVINTSINALNKHKKELEHKKELSQQSPESYELKEMELNELKI